MILQQKLKYLRKQMGLSQLELAEKLQVSRQAVSGWESGTSKPSTESLKSLGALYDVPLEYLLNENISEASVISVKETISNKTDVDTKKRLRQSILIIMAFVILLSGVIVAIYIHEQKENIVLIEDLADDTNWESSEADEFSIDW